MNNNWRWQKIDIFLTVTTAIGIAIPALCYLIQYFSSDKILISYALIIILAVLAFVPFLLERIFPKNILEDQETGNSLINLYELGYFLGVISSTIGIIKWQNTIICFLLVGILLIGLLARIISQFSKKKAREDENNKHI